MNPTDNALPTLLARLQLTALRDRLDTLLDEAARRDLNLREALTFLCQAEVARREQQRLEMAARLAKFPFARTLVVSLSLRDEPHHPMPGTNVGWHPKYLAMGRVPDTPGVPL